MSVDEMRCCIADVYTSYSWRHRVANMPEHQVISIYYSFLERGVFEQPPKKGLSPRERAKVREKKKLEEAKAVGLTGVQLTFDDVLVGARYANS